MDRKQAIAALQKAFKAGKITLYLGAGVSVANGLPSWDQLILAMYFAAISEEKMKGWRPFPNYLYAIAEFQLNRSQEPLEIMARKIRKYYPSPKDFLKNLKMTLYQGFMHEGTESLQPMDAHALTAANPTLAAVASLCNASKPARGKGIRSVITYNYDNLLEMALTPDSFNPIFNQSGRCDKGLPVFHVHGYVPADEQQGSRGEDIVFTEDQYHQSAQDPYSWRNLIQIQALSRSVGLMVGLSLADRNMRRFLDAVKRSPLQSQNFALLRKTKHREATNQDLDRIHEKAKGYMEKFQRSGLKTGRSADEALYLRPGIKAERPQFSRAAMKGDPRYRTEIRGILKMVEGFDEAEQEFVLQDIGITPIWYENYDEIPQILSRIQN